MPSWKRFHTLPCILPRPPRARRRNSAYGHMNDQTGRPEWICGIKYTIKDGIVYDAKKLLADVAAMVEKQKQTRKTSTSSQQ
jgi:hypothetical protein